MYVYIHITHTYIHTHILKAHIYTHTHTHTHIHACMHAYIHAYKERERVEGVGEDREGKRKRRRERGRGLHACACACVRARKCVCACVREFPRARARTSAGGRAAAWRGSPRTSPHRLCTDPKAAQDQAKTRFQLLPVSVKQLKTLFIFSWSCADPKAAGVPAPPRSEPQNPSPSLSISFLSSDSRGIGNILRSRHARV